MGDVKRCQTCDRVAMWVPGTEANTLVPICPDHGVILG